MIGSSRVRAHLYIEMINATKPSEFFFEILSEGLSYRVLEVFTQNNGMD